jgi:uncharacterized membrane protein YfcA
VDISAVDLVLAAAAAFGAGVVNALAGGGTLITFPTLVALGVPAVRSNITNTVALCPGYFGGTFAQRGDLAEQRVRLVPVGLVSGLGGLLGSILLVASSEELFRALVPFLLLGACALLAFQDRIRAALPPRAATAEDPPVRPSRPVLGGVFVIAVYGGYFGAGMGIVALAALSLALPDHMVRVNALKQYIAFITNVVAAAFFLGSGEVVWRLALVMAPASLVGGTAGGRFVRKLDPRLLRAVVVTVGVVVAVKFWAG